MNPLVLLAGDPPTVARLPVVADLQHEIEQLFEQQAREFVTDEMSSVEFDGGYNADVDEILYIDNFTLPPHILNAINGPLGLQPIDLHPPKELKIKSVFGGSGGGQSRVLFQAFDQRRLLTRSTFALFHTRNTFTRLRSEVIMLDHQLAAMFEGGKLYFRSFSMARRVLELGEYFREATNDDLEQFTTLPHAVFEHPEAFISKADMWIRRKIALITADGILGMEPRVIRRAARKLNVTVNLTRKDGQDAILFPAAKKELKELLRFLDEDLYKGPITDRMLVSNSKREYS